MQHLLEFLAKIKHWFLFIFLEVLSLVLLFRFNNYQGGVYFTTANGIASEICNLAASVERYFNLEEVNAALSKDNHILQRQVNALNRRLQKLTNDTTYSERLQLEVLKDYSMVDAEVVDNSVNRDNNFITINKGKKDGISPEMGVVSSNGIVGIVYMVSDHYALVSPIINVKSQISCRIRRRGYFGYLHWEGGNPRHASLDDIPRHAQFKKGDFVETSGYSSVFPEGLLVGQIKHIGNSSDGLAYKLDVLLSTNFSKLHDVSVIVTKGINEQKFLKQKALEAEKNEEGGERE